MSKSFRLGITRDFLKADGAQNFCDYGLESLRDNPQIAHEILPDFGPELPAQAAHDFDALPGPQPLSTNARLTSATAAEARNARDSDSRSQPAKSARPAMM